MGDRAATDALFGGFAEVAKALASGRRVEVVDLLAQGERSVDEIAEELGQSEAKTSHHVRAMPRAGLLRTQRQGTRIYYLLASDCVAELLRDIAVDHLAGIDRLAGAYLGERDGVEVVDREELAARLRRREVVVLEETGFIDVAIGSPADTFCGARRTWPVPTRCTGTRSSPAVPEESPTWR